MAFTGFFLIIFLIVHLTGNLMLFANDGGIAFNEYSHMLTSFKFILVIEFILAAGFLFHIVDGILLYIKNRKARGGKRYVKVKHAPSTVWSSRNMLVSGALILLFLIIHLRTFFVPYRITKYVDEAKQEHVMAIDEHGEKVINLFELTRDAFYNPVYSIFYVVCMLLLGLHLHHGFTSAFQTVGLRNPAYYGGIKAIGIALSIIITGGFAAMPLYFLFEKLFS